MKTMYKTEVTSQGGRDGSVRSSDGILDLQVGMPGGGGQVTNPEQLFGAGFAACYHSALKAIAQGKNMDTSDSEVTAHVSLHKGDDGYMLSVLLEVAIPGLDEPQIMELAEAAHQMCPYSKATRGNIAVDLKAKTA
ncbi:organic hydroperoxide resistance protein [Paenibacillus daejeonensis]|uniref:organic hydroperoxide resistance protein n=1 Tax=Paenibacillus daejeonensis TaxID=135193 RepID=UPI0004779063|nr:organic hydroperoxide resistance protein [Paenibacillus daejeonensis]